MSTAPAVDTYVSAALAPLRTLARALTRLGRAVRRRPIVGILMFLGFHALLGFFSPAPAYADDGPPPTGFGDLLVGPTLRGGHHPTLYQRYPPGAYTFATARLTPGTSGFTLP